MKVTVTQADGTQVDVTEAVRIAYDCVRQSMDWGSGFLDVEEIEGIVALARACEFPDLESAEETLGKRRKAEAERKARFDAARAASDQWAEDYRKRRGL